jgi:hypothetical protein
LRGRSKLLELGLDRDEVGSGDGDGFCVGMGGGSGAGGGDTLAATLAEAAVRVAAVTTAAAGRGGTQGGDGKGEELRSRCGLAAGSRGYQCAIATPSYTRAGSCQSDPTNVDGGA